MPEFQGIHGFRFPGETIWGNEMNKENVLHVEIGPRLDGKDRALTLRHSVGSDDGVSDNAANGSADGLANGHGTGSGNGSGNGSVSLDTLARLLSERNIGLLKQIKESAPRSVAELARLSGRPKASLTLTLRRFEKFGIIEFREVDGKRKVPVVVCDRLMLGLDIDADV